MRNLFRKRIIASQRRSAIIIPLFLALGMLTSAQAQTRDYYVYSRGNLEHIKSGNPDLLKPDYWVVRVFFDRNDGQAMQGYKCAATDAKTPGGALDAAKKLLKFNIRWAKFIYGSAWESNLTNCSGRNIKGPIAVMSEEVPWAPARIPDSLKEANEQLQTARETFSQIEDVLEISDPHAGPRDGNPYEHAGSVLKEYSQNLREAVSLTDLVSSKLLNGATLSGLGTLVDRLNDVLSSLRDAETLARSEVLAGTTANPDQEPIQAEQKQNSQSQCAKTMAYAMTNVQPVIYFCTCYAPDNYIIWTHKSANEDQIKRECEQSGPH